MGLKLIIIGASAGALDALEILISGLMFDMKIPIVIITHQMKDYMNFLPDILQKYTKNRVIEIEDKMKIEDGYIYLAPSNYHTTFEKYFFTLSVDELVNHSRPSIDVSFKSAAEIYKSDLIGILLTGSGHDGVNGLKSIKNHGGLTIIQDPQTAEFTSMPNFAINEGIGDYILALRDISYYLNNFFKKLI